LLELIAGPEFLPAYPLLVILGIAAIIDLVGVGFEPALIAAGKTKVLFRIQLIVTAFLVGLMVALLTRYGATGGAAALLAASCASFLLLGAAVARIFRSRSPEMAKVEGAAPAGGGEPHGG
jgi:O-antigen/teichoic acid export membrane protein